MSRLLHHLWTSSDHGRTQSRSWRDKTSAQPPLPFPSILPWKTTSDDSIASVQIDAKKKMHPLICRSIEPFFDTRWQTETASDLTWRRLLSQPSSNIVPPNVLPLSQNESFLAWRVLYPPKHPNNNKKNSQPWFTSECAAAIAPRKQYVNIYHRRRCRCSFPFFIQNYPQPLQKILENSKFSYIKAAQTKM